MIKVDIFDAGYTIVSKVTATLRFEEIVDDKILFQSATISSRLDLGDYVS